ncbi:MAG: hypothetical protein KAW89_04795 [Armatimonadetes bacterium]|nr:hypothetical protein [Armatimonadota bacterium]
MSHIQMQNYLLTGVGLSTMLVGVAVLVALVYLYVTVRLRGTLFLLLWKSPLMALGAYLYLRSEWRWPKSLLVWGPFALLAVAWGYVYPYMWVRWLDHAPSQMNMILGLSLGAFTALTAYAKGLITSGLLLLAIIFLIQDFLHLRRQPRNLDEELAAASEGLQ